MATDDVTSLAFDPNYMGAQTAFTGGAPPSAAPTVQTQGGDSSAMWQRIQAAAKAGLVSQTEMEKLRQKLGYGQAMDSRDFSQNKPPAPNTAGTNPAVNFGNAVGGLVGGAARAGYNALNAPTQPGAPLDLGGGGVNPPSPAWNQ